MTAVAEAAAGTRFLEDFAVGDHFEIGAIAVDEAAIVAFARDHDPQSFHLDPEADEASPFGRLVASGWQTAALTMRLMVDARFVGTTPLIGLGVEALSWPRPVVPGDVLTATVEILDTRPSRSRADRGAMRTRTTTVNQKGESVYEMTSTILMPRRGG